MNDSCKIFFLLWIFILGTALSSQTKKTLDVDEAIEKELKEEIEDSEIVVEGKSEEYLKEFKDKTDIKKLGDYHHEKWREVGKIKRKRKGRKRVELNSKFELLYGTQHTLRSKILVTKKHKNATYLFKVGRNSWDSIRVKNQTIEKSAYSQDDVHIASSFTFLQKNRLFIEADYFSSFVGAQKTPLFETHSKKGGALNISNVIRPNENQKVGLHTSTQAIYNRLQGENSQNSLYLKGELGADWQYIFFRRNAIVVKSKFSYAEENIYEKAKKPYRMGSSNANITLPLWSAYTGEGEIPLQLNLTLGGNAFYGIQYKSILGPFLELDLIWGIWHTRLLAERIATLPNRWGRVLKNPYLEPSLYQTWEEYWHGALEQSWKFKKVLLRLNTGAKIFNSYYQPTASKRGLFTLEGKNLNEYYAKIETHTDIGNIFYWNLEALARYWSKRPNLSEIWKLTTTAGIRLFWLDISISTKVLGPRNFEKQRLPLTALIDSRIQTIINETLSLSIVAENMINMKHSEMPGYLTPGAGIFASVELKL